MSTKTKYFDDRFDVALLHPRFWLSWVGIGVLVVFGLMPAKVRDPIAKFLAMFVYYFASKPIHIARVNLSLCFPDKSEKDIEILIKNNVRSFVMILLGQAEILLKKKSRLASRVKVNGYEHIQAVRDLGKPIVFIMPHVWAMEYAGLRLNLNLPIVTMAKAHRNALFNWFSNKLRISAGGRVYMRQAGIRALITELKQGNSFFYLPDEDHGMSKSVFVPFFNTTKATLPVVGRLAAAGNAAVMPVQIGYNEKTHIFELTVLPEILAEQMQGKENEARVLNIAVEQVINAYPEQYMWFLKILKTRPDGTNIY